MWPLFTSDRLAEGALKNGANNFRPPIFIIIIFLTLDCFAEDRLDKIPELFVFGREGCLRQIIVKEWDEYGRIFLFQLLPVYKSRRVS